MGTHALPQFGRLCVYLFFKEVKMYYSFFEIEIEIETIVWIIGGTDYLWRHAVVARSAPYGCGAGEGMR
jgi:hypothetical protein